MLVVSDATPLNILIRSGVVDVLSTLFVRVLIPPAVRHELTHERTPEAVRRWVEAPPTWLEVRAPATVISQGPKGLGEREAISLAIESRAVALLADDKAARRTAASLGVPTTGTVGVLEAAATRGLLDLRATLDRVRAEGLFLSAGLIEAALARDALRRQAGESGSSRLDGGGTKAPE